MEGILLQYKNKRVLLTVCSVFILVMLSLPVIPYSTAVSLSQEPSVDDTRVREIKVNIPSRGGDVESWGGRIESVAVQPGSLPGFEHVFAASTSGGLFKSEDGGRTWRHVDSLPAIFMKDVDYLPWNPEVVIATARRDSQIIRVDGYTTSGGGIWVSRDGGETWEKPVTSIPSAAIGSPIYGCMDEVSAYGIAFDTVLMQTAEGVTERRFIYVGTDCGLAISEDDGQTWRFKYSIPGALIPRTVLSVNSPGPGIVDLCLAGAPGFRRYDVLNDRWLINRDTFPPLVACTGIHALASSPAESNVIFAAVVSGNTNRSFGVSACRDGAAVMESNDGGNSWNLLFLTCGVNRAPFVSTTPRFTWGLNSFSIYFGNGGARGLVRLSNCSVGGTGLRCSNNQANWGDANGNYALEDSEVASSPSDNGWLPHQHADNNDIAWIMRSDGPPCPVFLANDGGVERSDDCGFSWRNVGNSKRGLNALQLYGVWGRIQRDHTDLYIGTQDNGVWHASLTYDVEELERSPWIKGAGAEGGFNALPRLGAEDDYIVYEYLAESQVSRASLHFDNFEAWNNPRGPFTRPGGGRFTVSYSFGFPYYLSPNTYLQSVGKGFFITSDNSRTWSWAGNASYVYDSRQFKIVGSPSDPIIYVHTPSLTQIAMLTNILPADGSLSESFINIPTRTSLAVYPRQWKWEVQFQVNPNNPSFWIIATNRTDHPVYITRDGGASWEAVDSIKRALTWEDTRVVNYKLGRILHPQVSAIAFHPSSLDIIFVGTEASGVLVSLDGGRTWGRIPGSEKITVVSGFFFDRDGRIFVSSWGRGLWVIEGIEPLEQPMPEPDIYEPNDTFDDATLIDPASMRHLHLLPTDAVDNENWIGEVRRPEMWLRIIKANLHSPTDVDYYKIILPDPMEPQDAHGGLPECASIERDHEFDGLRMDGWLELEGEFDANLRLNFVSGVPTSREDIKLFNGDTGEEISPEVLRCPRTNGLRSIVIAVGWRDFSMLPRLSYPNYTLSIKYMVDVTWRGEIPDWIEERREAGRVGSLTCSVVGEATVPGGLGEQPIFKFPNCKLASEFNLFHPPLRALKPDCRADGPGCPMYYPFNWQTKFPLDMTFTSSSDMRFVLLNSEEKIVTEAIPVGIKSEGTLSLRYRQDAAAPEEGKVYVKRMYVPELEPGLYILMVEGTEGVAKVYFVPPPEPEDRDGDGITDYFEDYPTTVTGAKVETTVTETVKVGGETTVTETTKIVVTETIAEKATTVTATKTVTTAAGEKNLSESIKETIENPTRIFDVFQEVIRNGDYLLILIITAFISLLFGVAVAYSRRK